MPLYKKKPVTIEARQTSTDNYDASMFAITWWIAENSTRSDSWHLNNLGYLVIHTLEGPMTVKPGWWVIKGVKGEFYPCDPEIFEMTYEFIGPRGYDTPYMVN